MGGSPYDNPNEVTSIKNGKGAVGNYYLVKWGVTDSAVYATSFKEDDGGTLYKIVLPEALTFSCTSIKQPIHFWLKNRAAYAHAGVVVVKFYKSSVSNPTSLSQLTALSSPIESGIISFSATSGEMKECMFYPQVSLSLNNEYLVLIFNWKVTTAGTNVNAGVKFVHSGTTGSFVDVIF
jgi:hypothetical protein